MSHEIEHEIEDKPTLNWLIGMLLIVISVLILCGYSLDKYYEPQPLPAANRLEIFIPLQTESDTILLTRATTYWCDSAQCDSNPYSTADGSIINPDDPKRWCALSRDLLYRWGGEFHYGDTIEIYSAEHENLNGLWIVHDCMNAKYKMSIDFLMAPEMNIPKLGIGTDVKIITCGN